MAITAAELVAKITVDSTGLTSGLKQAEGVWRDASGRLRDQTGRFVKDAETGFASASKSVSGFGLSLKSLAGIGIAAGLAQIGKEILEIGVSYEKAMNVFQAVTRASSDEMAKAAKVAQELGADMKLPATSAADAALAMTELAKGGLTAAQSMDAARGVLELAAAATISEAQAAEITANALNTFSLAATDAGKVSDLLAAAANASSAEITDIAIAMQQSGAAAAGLKIPIDDLVTAIGEMANAGIKGSDAGTSLRVFMTRLAPETDKAARAMKQLGIDAFDSSGKFVGLEAIIRQAAPALARMTDEQKQHAIQTAFGTDAMRAARIILEGGIDKFKQMEEAVNRSGAAQELAAAKTKGLGGAWEGLKSQLETVALSIFQVVAPALESLVRTVADGVAKIQELWEQYGKSIIAAVSDAWNFIKDIIGNAMQVIVSTVSAASHILTLDWQGLWNDLIDISRAGANILETIFHQLMVAGQNMRQRLQQSLGVTTDEERFANFKKDLLGVSDAVENKVVPSFKQYIKHVGLTHDITVAATPKTKGLGDEIKGAGSAAKAAKPMFDEFASGITGLSKAIDIIKLRLGDPDLFSSVSKSAKASMAETKAAFKVGADAIESLFEAMGQKVKVTIERLAGLGKGAGSLLDAALGFQKLKEAIENLNFDRAAKGLAVLDDEIKLTGKTIEIAFNTFRGLSAQVVKDVEKVGFTFKVVFPDVSKLISGLGSDIEKVHKETTYALAGFGSDWLKAAGVVKVSVSQMEAEIDKGADVWTAKFKKSMEEMSAAAPHWAGETVKAAERVKAAIEGSVTLTVARARLDQKAAIDGMISDFERLATQTGLSGAKFKAFVEANIRKTLEETGRFTKQQIDQMVEEWKKGIERLPGIWESVFGKLPSSVKGPINDVLKIIDTMPGKIGDTLRKTQSEFEKWLNFIDNIFGLIHRIFDKFPESLSDVISKTTTVIKNVGLNFKSVSADISDVMKFASDESRAAFDSIASAAESGSARTVDAIVSIGSALAALGSAIGGKAGSAISGAGAGAALGAKIGSIIPGIGTLFGGIIGAIGGFFGGLFGGKSRHEKEMERQQEERGRLEIERLKKQIQKDAQEVVQAALQTMRDAMATLEQLADYTSVGKKHITRFFKDLEVVLKLFFDLSTKWGSDLLDKAKSFAEKVGPAIEVVGLGVQALSLLGSYLPVADRIIVEFFRDLGSVIEKFGALADEIPNKIVKHAKRLAKRLGPIAEILGPFIEGFSNLFAFKAVPEDAIDAFAVSLEAALMRIGELADRIDRQMMKDAQKFADRAAAVVALVGVGVEAFIKMAELKPVTAEAFDALFEGFEQAINRMTKLVTSVDVEMLARAEMVAAKSLAIFEAIKAAVETFNLLRDYSSIPVEAFDALVNDFSQALVALDKMIDFTDELQAKAEIFRDAMIGVRDTLQEGIDALRDVVRFAGAALEGITQEMARGGGTTLGVGGGSFATARGASYTTSDHSITIGTIQLNPTNPRDRALADALESWVRDGTRQSYSQSAA